MTPAAFAEKIGIYCRMFSCSVTSWHRTVKHNREVGGVPDSAHLMGLAVDVVYDGSPPGLEADRECDELGLRRIREGDHDHIMAGDWRV